LGQAMTSESDGAKSLQNGFVPVDALLTEVSSPECSLTEPKVETSLADPAEFDDALQDGLIPEGVLEPAPPRQNHNQKVRLLDPHTINQIAAGEVVERPASALKELMENSIDAGASRIFVEIRKAGKELIKVSDNGSGMSPEDARVAMLRHATSKITSASDLLGVSTLGFRGEALASLASVARMTLQTAVENGPRFRLRIEDGAFNEMPPVGGTRGTEIALEDLFYNTPARLKFLKTDATELSACLDVAGRLAVARPDIAIKVFHGKIEAFSSPGTGNRFEALASVWSRDMARSLAEVDAEVAGIKLKGFISPPHITKPSRAYQYLFVNGRSVRSRSLTVALDQAYRDLTPERRFPVVALMLEIDPSRIDVNVSPTKSEVKFAHEGSIFEALRVAIRGCLMEHGMMPSASSIAIANAAIRSTGVNDVSGGTLSGLGQPLTGVLAGPGPAAGNDASGLAGAAGQFRQGLPSGLSGGAMGGSRSNFQGSTRGDFRKGYGHESQDAGSRNSNVNEAVQSYLSESEQSRFSYLNSSSGSDLAASPAMDPVPGPALRPTLSPELSGRWSSTWALHNVVSPPLRLDAPYFTSDFELPADSGEHRQVRDNGALEGHDFTILGGGRKAELENALPQFDPQTNLTLGTAGLDGGAAEGVGSGLNEGLTNGLAEGAGSALAEGLTNGLAEGLAGERAEGLSRGPANASGDASKNFDGLSTAHFALPKSYQSGRSGGFSSSGAWGSDSRYPYGDLLDGLRVIGQANNTFIIAETRRGLAIIDQHVAHERVLYEWLCGLKGPGGIDRQQLLVPLTLTLDRKSAVMMREGLAEVSRAGFDLEPFGGDSFLVRSVPSILKGKDPMKTLTRIAEELADGIAIRRVPPTCEQVWAMASCKMAVKAGDPLSLSEMQKLLEDLAFTENPYLCPHGRPITVTLDGEAILRLFKRL